MGGEHTGGYRALRAVIGLVGLMASLFVLAALVSFSPYDPPSPKAGVYAERLANLCGPAGAFVAYHLFYWLGAGAYALLGFVVGGFFWYMVSRRIPDALLRVVGVGILVVTTACAAALTNPSDPRSLPEGNGGVVGIALTHLLVNSIHPFGAVLALIGSAGVGLVLAADSVLAAVPRLAVRLLRRGRTAVVATGSAAGRLVVSEAKTAQQPAPPTRARPARPEPVVSRGSAAVAPAPDRPAETRPSQPRPEPAQPASRDRAQAMSRAGELVIRSVQPKPRGPAEPPPQRLGDYALPPLTLLKTPAGNYAAEQEEIIRAKAAELERTLAEFGIEAAVVQIDTGPVITMFELDLAAGTKVSQIVSLQNDIARALAAPSVRIVAPIPGKRTVGIEVPNANKEQVRVRELIELAAGRAGKMALPVFLGKDASGEVLLADLASMPHMLIAGTTGSGKSVCINTVVMSILLTQRPDHVKLILVDPKAVEMTAFRDLPHLLCPIVTDMHKAAAILEWLVTKMEERYELLAEVGARNIAAFNRLSPADICQRVGATTDEDKAHVPTHMPHIVVIIDELADLMMTAAQEVEHWIIRLSQKSRAVGIHLVLATQSPRVNVVTGLIKANMPCRVSFRVSSKQESRIVLDQNGAETLLGEGDMLFLRPGTAKLIRAQGTLVDDEEITTVIGHLKTVAKPQFSQELVQLKPARTGDSPGGDDDGETSGERDELFDQATEIVLTNQRGSVSLLQRKLGIGYGRAARLIDQMAEAGIVGEYAGSNAREVQMTLEDWLALKKQVAAEQAQGME